jgi:hypothetical protein
MLSWENAKYGVPWENTFYLCMYVHNLCKEVSGMINFLVQKVTLFSTPKVNQQHTKAYQQHTTTTISSLSVEIKDHN